MATQSMITIIGVGHVFAISDRLNQMILERAPQVVCVELDPSRYQALVERQRSRRVPIQYTLLAMFQSKMAGEFGTEVGDEMLAAASAARAVSAQLAFIDVDASRMLTMLWKEMSVKEKLRLFVGALVGLVSSKEKVEEEMEAYYSNDGAYIESVGDQFPAVKKVLIDDRNTVMAKRIASLAMENDRVVAVVGDGHVPGIVKELGRDDVEVVRLRELMSAAPGDVSAEYTVSYVYGDGTR
ncbi:MAG: TraB/GumN family protein [Methanobacteriota archaeon]|nr:MAG: TraB/GumN family protein [Euryarchaeota archaeon]